MSSLTDLGSESCARVPAARELALAGVTEVTGLVRHLSTEVASGGRSGPPSAISQPLTCVGSGPFTPGKARAFPLAT